jgi:hypothetical protein
MQQTRIIRLAGAVITSVAAATFIAACSSAKIYVNEDPNADFSKYSTYSYHVPLGTNEQQGVTSVFSTYLMNATDREMQSRGYKKVDGNADLNINFNIQTQEKVRSTTSPSMGGYYGYRGGYYGTYGGYDTTTTQYTEGTLNVDLIDKQSDTLVWEGITEGTITDKVKENLEAAVNEGIPEIFEKFTHYAPGYVPPPPADGSAK